MSREFDIAKDNPLFEGIDHTDFEKIYKCMGAVTRKYKRDDIIILTGDTVGFTGLILSGGVRIVKEDVNGNVLIMTEMGAAELFGETLACAGAQRSPVTVQATGESEIMFIDYGRIISVCPSACAFHTRMIENMLKLIAKKNLMLNRKIEILSKRTIQEKILAFLDMARGHSRKFKIPYNREEMAGYLSVDRSALSKELGKMQRDGLIKFNKNEFEILF